ncbi:MAG: aspartate-semialdehyde dehydrogenase [Candidatus Omnitrophica bacterium]|nr:aspartate-semialdehyde dehydrogenase [Candidatus Omnitrophota bacterium]MBU4303679.1 aspartate-semialdehyde dehydrogenase [Candidatus Omnitrophota bacterium]MBU4419150.1 aspartate-semialdehyde dehydrogenase [Candidatus Omnitrophota bacterium]MBU4468437.1 aspartate-semialdehyde dehydrogenase [Candidatus Omnitrophota bacterium]MCG2708429.1 aspartate-semialdehyde dehydrogenase [Candidatus Omnitrophota bacterium]
MKKYNVAVIGAGVVGIEMLRVLKQRNFPVNTLKVFARSARDINVDGQVYAVEPITPDGFNGIDIALFAGTEGEKGAAVTYAAEAVKRGAVVIDNGADFRMDPKVPLVVPEVNAADVKKHKGIIANPNCSTIQMVVALNPIHKKVGIKKIIVTTLQAASGAGKGAVEQLKEESSLIAQGGFENIQVNAVNRAMPQQLAYNCFPHIGSFVEGDYTNEEWKLVKETRKIMHAPKIKISATTVRVPVRTGHSESVYIETVKPLTAEGARKILAKAPGVVLMDDPKSKLYPMPKDAEGKDETFVGRIRQDAFNKKGLWLWVVADNLRKGAATNAVQIAECLISGVIPAKAGI